MVVKKYLTLGPVWLTGVLPLPWLGSMGQPVWGMRLTNHLPTPNLHSVKAGTFQNNYIGLSFLPGLSRINQKGLHSIYRLENVSSIMRVRVWRKVRGWHWNVPRLWYHHSPVARGATVTLAPTSQEVWGMGRNGRVIRIIWISQLQTRLTAHDDNCVANVSLTLFKVNPKSNHRFKNLQQKLSHAHCLRQVLS